MRELELAERERQLVSVDDLSDGWNVIADLLRKAGEQYKRTYGRGAGKILNEALDEADATFERMELKREPKPNDKR